MLRYLGLGLFLLLFQGCALYRPQPAPATLSRAALEDKVRGGWAGQMIGVSIGAPTEFMATEAPYRELLNWDKPSSVTNSIIQDDLYVEMTFAKVMDDEGLEAPAVSYAKAFAASEYYLWHANYFARKNIRAGIMPPLSGHPKFNPHADDIDFQIEADFIGLMCPGMPVLSNTFCDRIGHVMNYGDGVYGGMFVSAMYAAAFFENDPAAVLRAGLAAIPAQSDYAELIRETIKLHRRYPHDFRRAWDELYIRYINTDNCPELVTHPVDIDARVNGACIALGLLYGEGDFKKSISFAVTAGQDSDCNGASAGGIIGTMIGFNRLPKDWASETEKMRKDKFAFTDYNFDDICTSTMRRIEQTTKMAGGRVSGDRFEIVRQRPQAAPLERWHVGRASHFVRFDMPAMKWLGTWIPTKDLRVSSFATDRAVLTFEGTGFIAYLRGGEAYGVAEIYLDGKSIGTFDGYRPYSPEETQFFYHTISAKPGRHRLEIVNTGRKHAKSTGTNVGVVGVEVYGRAD